MVHRCPTAKAAPLTKSLCRHSIPVRRSSPTPPLSRHSAPFPLAALSAAVVSAASPSEASLSAPPPISEPSDGSLINSSAVVQAVSQFPSDSASPPSSATPPVAAASLPESDFPPLTVQNGGQKRSVQSSQHVYPIPSNLISIWAKRPLGPSPFRPQSKQSKLSGVSSQVDSPSPVHLSEGPSSPVCPSTFQPTNQSIDPSSFTISIVPSPVVAAQTGDLAAVASDALAAIPAVPTSSHRCHHLTYFFLSGPVCLTLLYLSLRLCHRLSLRRADLAHSAGLSHSSIIFSCFATLLTHHHLFNPCHQFFSCLVSDHVSGHGHHHSSFNRCNLHPSRLSGQRSCFNQSHCHNSCL